MSDKNEAGNENQTGNENMANVDEGYGWFVIKPSCLQSCLSSRWILFCCCVYVGTDGLIASGLSAVVITSIEKRYFLQSSQVGAIFACYEVGGIIFSFVVSYYGHRHKARWLGLGSLVMGLGCFLFALPQLLPGIYHPIMSKPSDLCQHNQTLFNATTPHATNVVLNATNASSTTDCRSTQWYHLFILMLGQLVTGVGSSPLYTLGTTYLDENVSRKNSGVYLGFFFAVSTLGPGIGFLLGGYFLTIYVDITLVQYKWEIECLNPTSDLSLMLHSDWL